MEDVIIKTVESGAMTKDLAICVAGTMDVKREQYMTTEEFMNKIAENFQKEWRK